jgi:hypothetical protein
MFYDNRNAFTTAAAAIIIVSSVMAHDQRSDSSSFNTRFTPLIEIHYPVCLLVLTFTHDSSSVCQSTISQMLRIHSPITSTFHSLEANPAELIRLNMQVVHLAESASIACGLNAVTPASLFLRPKADGSPTAFSGLIHCPWPRDRLLPLLADR